MNKLSKYMFVAGIIVIALSIIRWFIIYNDPSQGVLGIAIGIILLGFADIYSERKNVQKHLDKTDKRIDAFQKWVTKDEFK